MARHGRRRRQIFSALASAALGAFLTISSGLTLGCGDSPTVEVIGLVNADGDALELDLSRASADAQGLDSLRLTAETAALEEELARAAAGEQAVLLRGDIEPGPSPEMLVIEVLPLDRFDYIPGTIPSLPEE